MGVHPILTQRQPELGRAEFFGRNSVEKFVNRQAKLIG
jgi:hypothetical protein